MKTAPILIDPAQLAADQITRARLVGLPMQGSIISTCLFLLEIADHALGDDKPADRRAWAEEVMKAIDKR